MTRHLSRLAWLLVPAAAACGATLLHAAAPGYLLQQGFPLDDSWIHAVYTREFARTGMLAYNPGIPATGETSPLWPLALFWIHWLTANATLAVALTKAAGLALHAAAAICMAIAIRPLCGERPWPAWLAGILVAIHPDLLAASVSGMEVPLASLVAAGALAAAVRGSLVGLVVLGAASILARPETAVIAVVFPFLYAAPTRLRSALAGSLAAFAGAAAALGAMALRNSLVSGLPLPATFYVKASTGSLFAPGRQLAGFSGLLGQLTLVDSAAVIAVATAFAVFLLARRHASQVPHAAAGVWLTGVVFCVVSFALIPPTDTAAFYHQRYALPGVLLMVAALPLLLDALISPLGARIRQFAGAGFAVLLVVVCAAEIPARAKHLSNDARNIDDVQVAFGRALANADPADVLWAVDAGASRFFGRTFVIDLMGLNSPALLRPGAETYLEARPPAYIDVFPSWSSLTDLNGARLPARVFQTSTRYTVTSAEAMRLHVLVTCRPEGTTGRLIVRGRSLAFRCRPPAR